MDVEGDYQKGKRGGWGVENTWNSVFAYAAAISEREIAPPYFRIPPRCERLQLAQPGARGVQLATERRGGQTGYP